MSDLRGGRRPRRPASPRTRPGVAGPPAHAGARRTADWRRSASSSATASGSSCSATSSCSPPSSPPMRCWSATRRAGRAGGSCSTCAMSGSRRPACCSRASPAASRASAPERIRGSWFYGAMAATFLLGAAFHRPRGPGVRGHGRARGRPDPERVPLGLLYAGRLPRPACDRRPAVAADDDGAGVRQGVPAPTFSGAFSASACSGTPWTSFGLRCSPWCI